MKRLMTLILWGAMCVATAAHAVVETNRTPTRLGIRPAANAAYFFVAETLTTSCAANVIWISLSDASGLGKTTYATILAAKVMGKKISYMEYTVDANGNCYLLQAEVAQ
jgi:hypothetical protein